MGFFRNFCGLFGSSFLGGNIMMIIIFAIIAYFVYDYYKNRNLQLVKVRSESSPITQVEYMFAKGEISEDEYLRILKVLNDSKEK